MILSMGQAEPGQQMRNDFSNGLGQQIKGNFSNGRADKREMSLCQTGLGTEKIQPVQTSMEDPVSRLKVIAGQNYFLLKSLS